MGETLWDQVELLERREDSLYVAKHGGQSQTEEHNEEQYGPDLGPRHL